MEQPLVPLIIVFICITSRACFINFRAKHSGLLRETVAADHQAANRKRVFCLSGDAVSPWDWCYQVTCGQALVTVEA